MSRNNDVFQVLVPDPAQSVLAAGSTQDDLAVGQLGVFDADTNLSIDGTGRVNKFFIALGESASGDGTMDTIRKSAGQLIQARNIRFYAFRPHTAPQPMIVEITDYKNLRCDKDYTIKLEFRNQEIYRRQGYNQFSKPYSVRSGCCDECQDCPKGNPNVLTQKLVAEINADVDQLATAEPIATEAITIVAHGTSQDYAVGDVISDADLEVLVQFNKDQESSDTYVGSGIRLTTNPVKVKTYGAINVSFYKPLQTVIIVSLVSDYENGGFNCIGKVTTTQEAAYEEGTGYNVRQVEYEAGGWNGNPGPYRVNTVTGLARGIEYQASIGSKYNQLDITYDQFSVAGWLEHLNNLSTKIAFPTTQGGSTTAQSSFITVMDRIAALVGLDTLADDAAAANDDPEVVEPTEDAASQDLDGIG